MQFLFVAHEDMKTGSAAIQSILNDVGSMCEVNPSPVIFFIQAYYELSTKVPVRLMSALGRRLF